MKVGALGAGSIKSLGCLEIGPVATVRMQKTEIKYKKPTVQDCAEDHPFRSVGRNRLTRNSVRWSPGVWWSRGRTPTLALGVGGRLFPGSSARADRRLFHSQIFFPQLNVFSALPRWKSSPAFDCKHLRRADECQHIANERRFPVQAGIGSLARNTSSRVLPESSIYFLACRYPGGGQNFGRQGAGPVG